MRGKTLATLGIKTKNRGIIMLLLTSSFFLSLVSYSSSDDCLNVVNNVATRNLLGSFGAIIADVMYQYLGLAVFLPFPFLIYLSYKYISKTPVKFAAFKIFYTLIALICVSFILGAISRYQYSFKIPLGGVIGVSINKHVQLLSIKLVMISASLILIGFYPYFVFTFGNKIKRQKLKHGSCKHSNSIFMVIYKIVNCINTIVLMIFLILKSPLKCITILRSVYKKNKIINKRSSQQNVSTIVKQPLREEYRYNQPMTSLLKVVKNENETQSQFTYKSNLDKLAKILGDFGVRGEMTGYRPGPIVTLYEFKPQAGVKASRVIGLADDIARTMMVGSVRIATISGRDTLGIEVPNKNRDIVCFRRLIESQEYQQSDTKIPLVLGCNIFGKPIVADLTDMPHLLIAGTTGSGKSVGINGMILSMLYKLSPEECKFIMIDPKMLEFSAYTGIPHLMLPVITDAKNAVLSLKWVVKEMENRYRLMSEAGVRNIIGYNKKIKLEKQKARENPDGIRLDLQSMHYIVVIIDEMADLMVVAGKEIEVLVQRLSQMARAAGIHLIMATQRPSVDVITGVIKANFPTRISYHVTSKIDSRTILGEQGAEQLLGKGDMLFMPGGSKTLRVHGPMITDEEVENVVRYLKLNNPQPNYITLTKDNGEEGLDSDVAYNFDNENDNILYKKALGIVMTEKKTSISYLQRKLRIGYNKAANFIEQMETDGIVSSPDPSGRRVLIKEDNV